MTLVKKKKIPIYSEENPLEAIRDITQGVAKGITTDLVGGVAKDTVNQIFGIKKSGELKPNDAIQLEQLGQVEQPKAAIRPSLPEVPENYLVMAGQQEISRQIESLRQELKVLIESSNLLAKDIEKAVMEMPVSPGIYHVNFFERLRSIIQLLRQQVEDSRTWLLMVTTKRTQKDYWCMYSKHGTTFGLSSERIIATAIG